VESKHWIHNTYITSLSYVTLGCTAKRKKKLYDVCKQYNNRVEVFGSFCLGEGQC